MINTYLKNAIPSSLAMFVSALYTIIDGIFVGQGVGDEALAAINIVLPYTVMIIGLANMLAVGGGALVSKNLGLDNKEKAVEIFRQVIKFLIILAIIISVISVVFTGNIALALGSTPNLHTMAVDYLRYYALFSIFNVVGIVLNGFVRNDGQPKLAMISTIMGAITNIILDYIFIFEFNMGIKGAAIATGLGQTVTVIILFSHFIYKRGTLTFGNVDLKINELKDILMIGFPSFLSQISFSFIVLIHNRALVEILGETGVSAYSILNYVGTNIYMVLFGLTLGVQPLISYNYGKKDKETILAYYKINIGFNTLCTIVYVGICFMFGENIVSVFTSDTEVSKIAYMAVVVGSVSNFIVGPNIGTIIYYQSIEMPKIATIICIFRSVIFLPISIMILINVFGPNGIWAGTILSETLTFITINLMYNLKKSTQKSIKRLDTSI